jgi:hypothetical protein
LLGAFVLLELLSRELIKLHTSIENDYMVAFVAFEYVVENSKATILKKHKTNYAFLKV